MTDFHIKSNRKRFYADDFGGSGNGGCLASARFQVGTGGVPGTQEWGPDEHRYVIWDAEPDWDDIGFPADYFSSSGGFFFPVAGKYHTDVNIHMWPPAPSSPDRAGAAILAIETGGSGHTGNWHDTQSATDESIHVGVQLVASTTRWFAVDGQMQISVVMSGNDFIIPKVLLWASIEIVRICEGVPDENGGPH